MRANAASSSGGRLARAAAISSRGEAEARRRELDAVDVAQEAGDGGVALVPDRLQHGRDRGGGARQVGGTALRQPPALRAAERVELQDRQHARQAAAPSSRRSTTTAFWPPKAKALASTVRGAASSGAPATTATGQSGSGVS